MLGGIGQARRDLNSAPAAAGRSGDIGHALVKAAGGRRGAYDGAAEEILAIVDLLQTRMQKLTK